VAPPALKVPLAPKVPPDLLALKVPPDLLALKVLPALKVPQVLPALKVPQVLPALLQSLQLLPNLRPVQYVTLKLAQSIRHPMMNCIRTVSFKLLIWLTRILLQIHTP
jgi:hypothetical protein